MKKMNSIILGLSLMSASAFAQATQSESNLEVKAKNKADKADEVITNRRFRAQNGSLSRFSLNAALSYSGGSLDKPFSADRPNITAAGDVALIAGAAGTFNGTYRLTKLSRINFGVGAQMLAPFHNNITTSNERTKKEFNDNQGDLDIFNPTVSFTTMDKIMGVQTILNAGVINYTAGNLTDAGYDFALDASLNTMYEVGKTGFSFGALVVATRNFFNDSSAGNLARQNETVLGFLPQAEYVINDTFNLRTIIRSHWFQDTRLNPGEMKNREVTQSVGLGISVSRDVFLYPNIQFAYENLQASNTNVGFSANINMF